ncbi:LVIVD repeat-containing protein [Halobacterium zhouii]|uniref:LVIVD repeat-containing protein n=1 Tax=Halobacterium zhouii TaxID=2902624 RepID=UPI001E3D40AE|nr:hypothetical protein [Halobacterium zhouii]
MRRRDVLRATAGATALPLVSTAATATTQDAYEPLGFQRIEGAKEAVVGDDGNTVYVAATTGFVTVDISNAENPETLATRRDLLPDREGGPLSGIYDVKVEGNTLLVVGPANRHDEPSLEGMLVYDVTDPANPTQKSFFETDFPIHNCFLHEGTAYLTANNRQDNPVVIVDVSGDSPTEIARWSIVDYNEAWADVHWYVRTCHDVYVHEDVLYIAHWDAGTWLVDVSDPANPEYVNHFGHYELSELTDVQPGREGLQLPGNSHYVAVNDDATVLASGAEAWDRNPDDERDGGPGGIDLWNISDPQNPEKVAFIEPPLTPDPTYGGVWTTSHNFDFHGDRLYTSWYRGGVKIHDVSDPANPEELAWWRQPDYAKIWAAQFARDGVFVGSDMASAGTNHPMGVYTFPDRAGEQANPPEIDDPSPNTTSGSNATQTATTQTTTVVRTAAEDTTTADATTRTDNVDPGTTTDGESGGNTPGFGVLAGLSAVSAGALAAWRRLGE